MNICIGSTSHIKYNAIKNACDILKVEASIFTLEIDIDQKAQPVGLDEIYNGAFNRAFVAKSEYVNHVAIGIENGILEYGGHIEDVAMIVILRPNKDVIRVTSAGIEFPYEYFEIAKGRGFQEVTVGQVIAEKMGGSHDDPHSTLTGGKISRGKILTDALVIALSYL